MLDIKTEELNFERINALTIHMHPVKMLLKAVIYAIVCIKFGALHTISKNVADLEIAVKLISRLENVRKVHVHTCWDKRSIKAFNKLLSTQSSRHEKIIQKTVTDSEDNQLVRIVDLHCEDGSKVLQHANKNDMFKWPSNWVIFVDEVSNFPVKLNIFHDSRVYILPSHGNNVVTLYRYQHEHAYNFQIVSMVKGKELKSFRSVREHMHRRNMRKGVLNVGFVVNFCKTYEELLIFRELDKDIYSKFHSHLIEALIYMQNATLVPHFVTFWGDFNKTTGRYTGLFTLFQNGSIEIGSCVLLITRERLEIINYCNKYDGAAMLVFRAPPLSMVKNILRMPLHDNVWMSIFLLLILELFIVLAISKWEWSQQKELQFEAKRNVLRPRVLDVVHMQVIVISQQGSEAEPTSASGHVATYVLFISFLFFYTAYSASIVALLQSTADDINTLDDMTNSDIRVQVDNVSYMPLYVKRALNSEAAINFHNTKIAPPGQPPDANYVSLHDGVINCIRDSYCALLADIALTFKAIINTYTEEQKCGLKVLNFSPQNNFYMPFRKGTVYKELFRVGLSITYEVGIFKRTKLRILPSVPKCENNGAIFKSVDLADCYFAFLCFIIGASFANFVLMMELIYYKFQQRHIN